jgi:hypothetical protein
MLGWLRVLSRWVGTEGQVVGSDVDAKMLRGRAALRRRRGARQRRLVEDDLFRAPAAASFDLVHARFQIAPLGRAHEQLAAFRACCGRAGRSCSRIPTWRRGGSIRGARRAGADRADRARLLAAGGNFNAGRELPGCCAAPASRRRSAPASSRSSRPFRTCACRCSSRASLRPGLEALRAARRARALLQQAEAELARPHAWGTTFTLIQVHATA